MNTRIEHDSLGDIEVPENALYGPQTQRAVGNFPVSGLRMPRAFIHALGLIKACAASSNAQLRKIDVPIAAAIEQAALEIAAGKYDNEFPLDVFQTGSGTSTNMNINEVIATLASGQLSTPVHPNDHVNLGQSTNDVFPSAIHISAVLCLTNDLLPALLHLQQTIDRKASEVRGIIKTGRTHLMDAMPLTMEQEFSGWSAQISRCHQRISGCLPRLCQLAQGGSSVGTGVNVHPDFAVTFAGKLSSLTGIKFEPNPCFFEAISCQDTSVELSGQLKVTAVAIMKIANDLRWMNSGPLTGIAEIKLQAMQPGSSFMPGKVNPVIAESAAMVAAQVMGNDTTLSIAGQSGNFQLNVMLPLIAYNLLQSITLLTNTCHLLADKTIATLTVCEENIARTLSQNPILVTTLAPVVGYALAAEIAKKAYTEKRTIVDVAQELTPMTREELERLLDPAGMV